jgi:polyisoprenoid-binding protein YceI
MLDVNRYNEIRFESEKVERKTANQYRVRGRLTIRDQTKPLEFDVMIERQGGIWRAWGDGTFQQSEFGIQPFTGFRGGVKTKDDVKVVFNIVLKPVPRP